MLTWRMCLLHIFIFCLFSFLLSLGFWQLSRSEEKQNMMDSYQRGQQQAPIPFSTSVKHYQTVLVSGEYDLQHQFLLDNQIHQQQIGYQVFTPLKTAQGWVLVNRGWIKRGASRQQLPDIPAPNAAGTMEAMVYYPSGKGILLGSISDNPTQWPRVMQKLDIPQWSAMLNQPLLPFSLRLTKNEPNGLVLDWTPVMISPARHVGYAVQWFSLAGALLLLYGYLLITIRNKHGKTKNILQ